MRQEIRFLPNLLRIWIAFTVPGIRLWTGQVENRCFWSWRRPSFQGLQSACWILGFTCMRQRNARAPVLMGLCVHSSDTLVAFNVDRWPWLGGVHMHLGHIAQVPGAHVQSTKVGRWKMMETDFLKSWGKISRPSLKSVISLGRKIFHS